MTTFRPSTTDEMHVCWGAILAGVVVGITVGYLFNFLGVGIGFSSFSVDANVIKNISIGSVIWLIISNSSSIFLGAWVAGRLSTTNNTSEGSLHGMVVWGLCTIITFVLAATTAGMLISGTTNMVGRGISLMGQGAASISRGVMQVAPKAGEAAKNILPDVTPALDKIKQQAQQLVDKAQKNIEQKAGANPREAADKAKEQLEEKVTSYLTNENENETEDLRSKVVDFLVDNTNLNQQQAQDTVENWQKRYEQMKNQVVEKSQQAKQKAVEATDKATDALAGMALTVFFIVILGGVASIIGGSMGIRSKNNS